MPPDEVMQIWLKAAMVSMALASFVLASTFLYVWRFIRRRYVLYWGLAWLFSLPHLLYAWRSTADPSASPEFVSQLLLIANAGLMLAGCHEFTERRAHGWRLLAISLPFVAWAALAPGLTTDSALANGPASVLLAVSYLWAAARFELLYRRLRRRGSRLVSCLFLIAGLHELDYPLLVQIEGLNVAGYHLAAVLAIAIAVSLLVIVLEDARADVNRESARLRGILANLPVGVLVTSPDGVVRLANDEARALLAADLEQRFTTVGELESEVFLPRDGATELPISYALRTGRAAHARQMTIRTADQTNHAALVNAGPVHDVDGSLLGAVAVFQDIKELQRAQAEVARADRLQGLGTLAAGVAHDFNNSLTMILGHAELAAETASDPEIRKQLDIIAAVARDSAATVRRIQDLARTRAARDTVTFDLAATAREVIELARPRWRDQANASGIRYEVRTHLTSEVLVAGQSSELREALLNLVLNALDAMPGGGSLEIEVDRRDGRAVLVVRDDGCGMPDEVRERIFDPFFTTKGARGTGLGLAVVFGIIKRHGGLISVTSEPAKGTTFVVDLPLATAEVEAEVEDAPQATSGLRILAVDDELLVRELMRSLLTKAGHLVTTAADGDKALTTLRAEGPFDVVLTDLGMPGMNGWQVAQQCHALAPGLPVVLVTGWGDSVSEERARTEGIAAVLPKPFSRAQLCTAVDRVAAASATAPA